MPRKNKILFLFLSEVLFLSLILLVIPIFSLKEKPGIYQASFENILSLDKNHTYTQEFISNYNNLNSVSVLLKNPSLNNHDFVYIDVQDQHKNILRSLSTSGFSIGDPSWIDFKFPVINSQIGDTFYIKITSDNLKDNNLYVYGDAKTNNINFKTTFTSPTIKESLQTQLTEYQEKLQHINQKFLYTYISLILILNVLIFLSYEPKKN